MEQPETTTEGTMNKEHRGYHHTGEAWYASASLKGQEYTDNITVGFYPPDGNTKGEFSIEWVTIAFKPTPILRSYDDSWKALQHCTDLIEKMAEVDNQNITPKEFCKILDGLGFKDLTKRKIDR
jgi:hypothetical protein